MAGKQYRYKRIGARGVPQCSHPFNSADDAIGWARTDPQAGSIYILQSVDVVRADEVPPDGWKDDQDITSIVLGE